MTDPTPRFAPGIGVRYIPVPPTEIEQSPKLDLRRFLAAVDTMTAAGITPPAAFTACRARWTAFLALLRNDDQPMLRRLIEWVTTGDGDLDMATLLVLARFETLPSDRLEMIYDKVAAATLAELIGIWDTVAMAVYRKLAGEFNTAAVAFAKAASTCDPTTSAETVLASSRRVQHAYAEHEQHAATQDALLPGLLAAAQLARPSTLPANINGDPDTLAPGLVIANIDVLDRRQVWAALRGEVIAPMPPTGAITKATLAPVPPPPPVRGGRWTRLHAIGALVSSAPDPAAVELFGPPGPYATKFDQGPNGRTRMTRLDPEQVNRPPRRSPLERLKALTLRRGDPSVLDTAIGPAEDESAEHEWHSDEPHWKEVPRHEH